MGFQELDNPRHIRSDRGGSLIEGIGLRTLKYTTLLLSGSDFQHGRRAQLGGEQLLLIKSASSIPFATQVCDTIILKVAVQIEKQWRIQHHYFSYRICCILDTILSTNRTRRLIGSFILFNPCLEFIPGRSL